MKNFRLVWNSKSTKTTHNLVFWESEYDVSGIVICTDQKRKNETFHLHQMFLRWDVMKSSVHSKWKSHKMVTTKFGNSIMSLDVKTYENTSHIFSEKWPKSTFFLLKVRKHWGLRRTKMENNHGFRISWKTFWDMWSKFSPYTRWRRVRR